MTSNKRLLVLKAQMQINNILAEIQAERDPFEWDKMRGIERAPDGKFAPKGGGGGSKPSSPSGSSSSAAAPTSSTGASSPGKIGAAVKVAQESLSDLEQRLTQISSDGIAQAKELWNSPEVQQIHEETKAKLEELSKGFGEAYDKTVKATGVDPKKIADAAKKGLDKIQGKTPDEKRSMADLAQLSLAGIETVGAITAGAFLVMGAKKLKPLGKLVKEKAVQKAAIFTEDVAKEVLDRAAVKKLYEETRQLGERAKKIADLPTYSPNKKGREALNQKRAELMRQKLMRQNKAREDLKQARESLVKGLDKEIGTAATAVTRPAKAAATAALFTAATEVLRQVHKGSVEKGMEEGKVSGEMKSYKDLMTNAFSIIEGGAKTVQDMFESEEE